MDSSNSLTGHQEKEREIERERDDACDCAMYYTELLRFLATLPTPIT